MPVAETLTSTSSEPPCHRPVLEVPVLLAVGLGLLAAWFAAGSMGLLGYPLQRTATWIFAILVLLVDRRNLAGAGWRAAAPLVALAAVLVAGTSPLAPVRTCAVGVLFAACAIPAQHRGDFGRARHYRNAAAAVLMLACWRLLLGVPWVWQAANSLVGILCTVVGLPLVRPLDIGPTLGGLDFLVPCLALIGASLRRQAWRGNLLLLAALITYLWLASFLAATPTCKAALSPFYLPMLAALLIGATTLLSLSWLQRTGSSVPIDHERWSPVRTGLALLAVATLPAVAILVSGPATLQGKRVVAFEDCFGNWEVPKHGDYGRLSQGMYGLMIPYIESLGATFARSENLSAEDLQSADVLVLLYPHKPWKKGQIERIHDYVRNGGSLLVCGEHTTIEEDSRRNRANELLEGLCGMRIAFDSATFEIGGWLQSYAAMWHPAAAGVGDERNEFGVVIGASVETSWPARPILVGRYGFNDPGDPSRIQHAMMGEGEYQPGERLGDIVLAAEQPVGKGRVVVFGDTSSFTNGVCIGAHGYTSRLFAYLANQQGTGLSEWRQWCCIVIGLAIIVLWSLPGHAVVLLLGNALFGLATMLCAIQNTACARVLPDGRQRSPNNLAYIDGTHFGRYSDESWRLDATMGLRLTLIRNGYLPLELGEFRRDRIERAGLVVSMAPRRKFTVDERAIVRDFIAAGGIFVITASYRDRHASAELLKEYDLQVGAWPGSILGVEHGNEQLEPQPMGFFKNSYHVDGRQPYFVRFYEGWPVGVLDNDVADILVHGRDQKPIVLWCKHGKGHLILIGDSEFATNKNLELESGQSFEGQHENADFWRYMLSRLRGGDVWLPGQSGGNGK